VEEVFSSEEIGGFGFILDDVYQTGNPYVGKELPVSIADGMGLIRDQFLNMNFHTFRNRNGEIIGVLAILHDVTERVLAHQALEASKAKLAVE